jgi:Tfp pilus tip-associated adhesin PilY1
VLALPRVAATETVDDTFLLTTSVKPNVILIFDNSTAMNQIEWHPAFNPATAPACAGIDPNTDYVATGTDQTYCGNTRMMYRVTGPGVPDTLWNGKYLAWYYSLSTAVPTENAILNQIATSTVTVAGCNTAGAGTRYTSQFRRTRADAMRQVFFDVLCLSEPKGLRFGLGIYRAAAEAGSPKVDPNGGFIRAAVDDNTPAHAADLEADIGRTKIDDPGTPITEAVFQFYTYLMPRVVGNIPYGKGGVAGGVRFPKYVYNKFGDDSTASGGRLPDPVQQACQKNYMILVTGGLATRDDFDPDPATTSQGFGDFDTLVGDYYSEGDTEVPGSADERTLYLDDLTKYMHENDLRPDFDDDQTIDFYTVGFGTTAADNAFLRRASETVGGGLHFTVQDGDGLSQALVDALNDIVEKSRSFTAATVPSARTADGGDFYNSFFLPSDKTAFWEGHLRAWHFTAAGEIVDSDDHCALVDPDGGTECNDGPFQVVCQAGQTWPACVVPFWDAGDATRLAFAPGTSNTDTSLGTPRQLYTSKLLSGTPTLVDFDMALTKTDLKLVNFTVNGVAGTPADPSPNDSRYTTVGSQALNADGLADEVVAYARGCFFGTGVTGADTQPAPDGQKPCAERGWLIGDIFHSDPIVVRNPPDRDLDASYEAFRTTYAARDRVIYTGTNGGYLEAFHAGDWGSTPAPGKYDEGSGEEMFGFMPWEARTKIKKQPVDPPANRTHYVDGAPQAADAWLYSDPVDATKQEADWHTVLAGGLREGGRHYYALDVTNPSGLTGTGKPQYPELLWEFPNEADFNSGSGDYLNMGETWGQPIMARVRLRVCNPTCNDNGGQGFERWVAIVTGGYDATSDPNSTWVDPTAAYNASSTKGRAIYMIDVKTGEVVAQQKVGTPGTPPAINTGTVQNQMQYSLVSTPAVIDIDSDGFADLVYVGDLGGNLYKWVIHAVGEDRVNDGTGLRTQPAWKFQHFFQAPVYVGTPSSTKYYKNIFQPPSAAYVNNTLWIAFGTGERAAIGFTDRLTDGDDPTDAAPDDEDHTGEENRFYAITDPDPLATAATAPPVVTEGGTSAPYFSPALTDITTVGTTVTSPRGYYFKTSNAEKFVTTTVIFAGKVITASFTPSQIQPTDPAWDPCTQRGNGKLYIFDLKTGRGVFDDGAGGEQRYTDIGAGLPTDPKISIGVGGDDNKIVVQQSGTEVRVFDAEDVSFGRGIIYWREMK